MEKSQKQNNTNSFEIMKDWQRDAKTITLIDRPGEFKLFIGGEQVPFVKSYKVEASRGGVNLVLELDLPGELFSNEVER